MLSNLISVMKTHSCCCFFKGKKLEKDIAAFTHRCDTFSKILYKANTIPVSLEFFYLTTVIIKKKTLSKNYILLLKSPANMLLIT